MTFRPERGTDFTIFGIGDDAGGQQGGGGISEAYETVAKNLPSHNAAFAYDGGGDLDTITYDLGGGQSIVKTFNYTGGDISSIVLSGDVPGGIDLTKTFTYSGGDVASIAYSI